MNRSRAATVALMSRRCRRAITSSQLPGVCAGGLPVTSLSNSDSNLDKAAKIDRTNRPCGVVVSTCSCIDARSAFRSRNASTMPRGSRVDQAGCLWMRRRLVRSLLVPCGNGTEPRAVGRWD